MLDEAVNAHFKGEHHRAAVLIAESNKTEVRDWVEPLWGPPTECIHRFRAVRGAPPELAERDKDQKRAPDGELKQATIDRDGYLCRFCGIPVIRPEIRQAMHRQYSDALPWGRTNASQHAAFQCLWLQFDHILPYSRGGRTDLDNLVITCGPCNFGRQAWTLEEVGLTDPRTRPVAQSRWDGLERFIVP